MEHMSIKSIISERRFKAGYIVREELIDGTEYGCEDFTMKSAYTPDGNYIGDQKIAHFLCKKLGIKPQPRPVETYHFGAEMAAEANNGRGFTCSIGFCEAEQKWYGWSHRAIYGFGVGETCKKGDCGYRPSTVDELYDSVTMPDEDGYVWVTPDRVEKLEDGIRIRHDMVFYTDENPEAGELLNLVPAEPDYQFIAIGRGEWTAKTLDDCFWMACDFAESIS